MFRYCKICEGYTLILTAQIFPSWMEKWRKKQTWARIHPRNNKISNSSTGTSFVFPTVIYDSQFEWDRELGGRTDSRKFRDCV
jgi:hypothetical protein